MSRIALAALLVNSALLAARWPLVSQGRQYGGADVCKRDGTRGGGLADADFIGRAENQ
ncbi:MAG: hypothetical protein ABI434_03195 [Burkholderiaceae bacterium]